MHFVRYGVSLALLILAVNYSVLFGQSNSVVTINADKVMVLNGRKIFPITISPGPPTNGKTSTGIDALQEFHDAGALFFRIAQTTSWNNQVIADQQAALDWAAQHGMYCMVNLRELSYFSATDTNKPASLRNVMNQFKNHPALAFWKNQDEAWWGGVSASDLQRGYDIIKQEDANHPVEQTHAPRGTVPDLQPYNSAADILALDIYPIGYPPGANSLLTNKEISMVGDYTDFLAQVANGQKHYWMIEQIAWSGVVPPAKTLRFPTLQQSRFMAYQAIIHGARGLMFFGGNVTATLNPQDAALGWNWTFWDEVLKPVVKQIGDNSLLAGALVQTNSSLPVLVGGATDVEFCVREVPPYLYLLACKREGATVNVTFSGLPTTITNGEVLYESPRSVIATNGQFSDWFGPFEVHAYRFALTTNIVQTNPPPTLYEPFAYSNIGGPVTSNTPSNWDFGGSGTNDLNVANGSLSYPGLATAIGNSVTNGGAGLGVRRLFGTNLSSGKVFISALFRVNDLKFSSWNGSAAQVGALTATDNLTFRLAVMIKSNSPSGYVVGLQKGGTSATTTFDTIEHTAGETLYLVGKYDFTTSPNTVSLWINPAASQLGGTSEPTGFIWNTNGVDGYTIDRFNMRQNTTNSVPAAMQWDELRLGFSWGEVSPAAAPTVVTLTEVTQLQDGAFQFSFADSSGRGYGIYGSTNLTDWALIGAATQVSPNLFQFRDTAATNHSQRFYQLRGQ
ncbi:MAG: Immunoglobulin I-set domain protein [Verrucomicrobiales bacterium]|nr:Immunoglobulin I-set domain protein [Verrucomicrobiales bacterium]